MAAIAFDEGGDKNVIIIAEHWTHGQRGFENVDVYACDAAGTKYNTKKRYLFSSAFLFKHFRTDNLTITHL